MTEQTTDTVVFKCDEAKSRNPRFFKAQECVPVFNENAMQIIMRFPRALFNKFFYFYHILLAKSDQLIATLVGLVK